MQQIFFLRWGTPKENYKDFLNFLEKYDINPYKDKKTKWSDNFNKTLWQNFELIEIFRINKDFADFNQRKIIFEKYLPYFKKKSIFIWHSLWWSFFLKYLEENYKILDKIKKIILIAPWIYNNKTELLWSFQVNTNFKNLINFQEKIEVLWSKDDPIVEFKNIKELKKALPKANFYIFENKWHFLQEKFPELIKIIKH